MPAQRSPPSSDGRRIVVCDYNALLQSVTGLLRMNGYRVFQAYDGLAVQELCEFLPDIELLILNTYGSGLDTLEVIQQVRAVTPGLEVLHIGGAVPGLPTDVPTLPETFTSDQLLMAVTAMLPTERAPQSCSG